MVREEKGGRGEGQKGRETMREKHRESWGRGERNRERQRQENGSLKLERLRSDWHCKRRD